jgi:hypothetical protein
LKDHHKHRHQLRPVKVCFSSHRPRLRALASQTNNLRNAGSRSKQQNNSEHSSYKLNVNSR